MLRDLRLLGLGLAALAAACASDTSGPDAGDQPARTGSGRAREAAFFAELEHCTDVLSHSPYYDALLGRIQNAVQVGLEPPYDETVSLSIRLDPVGFVEAIELRSVSNPAIEAPFALFAEAPPPLPRAPDDVRRCLGTEPFPFMVKIFERFVCESRPVVLAYHDDAGRRVVEALALPAFADREGSGWVRLRVGVEADGTLRSIEVQGDPDPLARDKLIAAVRHVEPFPPPPEFARCFETKPMPLVVRLFEP